MEALKSFEILKFQARHPWCKKVAAKNLKGHAKKMWNQNGKPRPPAVDEIIRIFDNDQATKH